jgi:hypothetical protein
MDAIDWEYNLIVAYEHAFGTARHHHLHPYTLRHENAWLGWTEHKDRRVTPAVFG